MVLNVCYIYYKHLMLIGLHMEVEMAAPLPLDVNTLLCWLLLVDLARPEVVCRPWQIRMACIPWMGLQSPPLPPW